MILFDRFGWRFSGAPSWALSGVSLHIGRGEFVAVSGSSGSGKTTLALAMCGLLIGRHDGEAEGTVSVGGQDIAKTPLHDVAQAIGLVQQNPDLHFATLDVSDEIAFGMENRCLAQAEIRKRSAEAMEFLSIIRLRGRSLATLSGGEKQRVAVASIVAGQPDAIVLDEPTASLDPQASRDLFHSLADLCRRAGLTVVVIEHKLNHLLPLKPRLVHLDEGGVRTDMSGDTVSVSYPDSVGGQRGTGDAADSLIEHDSAAPGARLCDDAQPCGANEPRASARAVYAQPTPRTAAHGHVACSSPAGDDSIVEISQITVEADGCTILDDVSLHIHAGEILAIMGPNGGGKSTLLHCLMGLVRPIRGTIRVCGIDVSPSAVSRLARHVGFVFQNADHQIFADTVWHEALFASRNLRMLTASAEQEAAVLLEQAGLSNRKEDHPYRLSWGQKRRLNLISAVLHQPSLLLLDEPFAGQDWENVAFQLSIVRKVLAASPGSPGSEMGGYPRQRRGACVMVTHDPRAVLIGCSRLLFVTDGRVTVDAAVPQAFDRLSEVGHGAYVPPEYLAVPNGQCATSRS